MESRSLKPGETPWAAGPRFDILVGRTPAVFIVSANLARRNMTSGQRAMAYAFIFPDPGKAGRKKNACATQPLEGFDKSRLSIARQVLRHSSDLALQVLNDPTAMSLDDALLIVRQAQNKVKEAEDDAKTEEEREIAQAAKKATELRECAPDLADLVAEKKMALNEAYAAMQERERTNEVHRQIGIAANWEQASSWSKIIHINQTYLR